MIHLKPQPRISPKTNRNSDRLINDWNSQDKSASLLSLLRIIDAASQGSQAEKVVISKNRQLVKRYGLSREREMTANSLHPSK